MNNRRILRLTAAALALVLLALLAACGGKGTTADPNAGQTDQTGSADRNEKRTQ